MAPPGTAALSDHRPSRCPGRVCRVQRTVGGNLPTMSLDLAKLRTIGVISGRTRPRTVDTRHDDGTRTHATTDETGHTVTEHCGPGPTGVSDRQDVLIRPKALRVSLGVRGE